MLMLMALEQVDQTSPLNSLQPLLGVHMLILGSALQVEMDALLPHQL